jgi:hypothetical protein
MEGANMKIAPLTLFLAAILVIPAFAADDRSPYDKNPACLDRNVDASTGDCVIKEDGTPRHTYPPRSTSNSAGKPASPVAAPVAAPREAAPAPSRRGG